MDLRQMTSLRNLPSEPNFPLCISSFKRTIGYRVNTIYLEVNAAYSIRTRSAGVRLHTNSIQTQSNPIVLARGMRRP